VQAENEPAHAQLPRPAVAWYLVGVLMVMYVFSFIDRTILGLLVDPIKREFGVSDTQVGLLQGWVFAAFYCTLGIPMGFLVDRFNRRWLVAAGVFAWSLMASACGMAGTFVQLVIARMGVGVGEATLSPSAYSMIADVFPKEKLGRALSVYNTGIPVGSALALILGGMVANAVSNEATTYTLPLLGEIRAWQLVFIATGAPGLLLCFLIFTVPEPARRGMMRAGGAAVAPVRFGETLRFAWERIGFFAPFFAAAGLLSMIGYGFLGWLPSALNRRFDIRVGDVAILNGAFTLLLTTAGIVIAGRVADALAARGVRDAAVRVCAIIAACTALFGTLGLLMPTLGLVFATLAISTITISAYTGLLPLVINLITPNQMRGQLGAIYLLVVNMIGFGGPWLMPFVSDHLIGDPARIYQAMAVVTAGCGFTAMLVFMWLRPRYVRRLEEAAAWS
jgi:MFS family permease